MLWNDASFPILEIVGDNRRRWWVGRSVTAQLRGSGNLGNLKPSRITGTWTHYHLVCDFTGFMNYFMAILESQEALFQVQIHSLSSLSIPCVPSSPAYLICSATFTSIHAAVFPLISPVSQPIIPPICLDLFNHLYSSTILPTHLAFILPLIHWSVCHPTCSSFPPNPLNISISICSTIHLFTYPSPNPSTISTTIHPSLDYAGSWYYRTSKTVSC